MQCPLFSVNFSNLRKRGSLTLWFYCSSRTMARRGMCICIHTHTYTQVYKYIYEYYTNIYLNISIWTQRESQQARESQSASGGTKQIGKKEEEEDKGDNIAPHSVPSASCWDSERFETAHVPPSLSECPVPSAEILIKPTCFFGIKERNADVELNWQPFRKP